MRQAKDQAALIHDPRQRHRVFHRGGQRLVTDHMNARFQERLRGPEMHMVGRHNRHDVNTVQPLRFRRGHFHEASESTLWRDMQFQRCSAASLGIGGQRRRHQLKMIIHPRRNAVYRSNERPRPTADHPQPQPPLCSIARFHVCCHVPLPIQVEQAIRNLARSF